MAEPPAPAISSAVTIGLASRITASTLAEPVNDCAPSWRVRLPSCSAMTAPNVDAYVMNLKRHCKAQGIDTGGSFAMRALGA